MSMVDWKAVSEVFSNFAMPIATVVAAYVVAWGANRVTDKVIHARGAGETVQAQPPAGFAIGGTSAPSSAPQGSARSIPDSK